MYVCVNVKCYVNYHEISRNNEEHWEFVFPHVACFVLILYVDFYSLQKQDFCTARNEFDEVIRKTERNYQRQEQDKLSDMYQSNNTRDFWKHIGRIGIANDRKQRIPFKVMTDDWLNSDSGCRNWQMEVRIWKKKNVQLL